MTEFVVARRTCTSPVKRSAFGVDREDGSFAGGEGLWLAKDILKVWFVEVEYCLKR